MRRPPFFKFCAIALSVGLIGIPSYVLGQDTAKVKQAGVQDTSKQSSMPAPSSQGAVYPAANTAPPPLQQAAPAAGSSKPNNFDDYLQGKMDGKREARGNPVWILAGLAGTGLCLCIGVAGIGIAFAVAPSPPETALMGKSTSYIQGYTEGYKSKGRLGNAGWATLGCTIAAVINIVINLATGYNSVTQ